MRNISPTSLGLLCVIGGIAIFSLQDVVLKSISGAYPLHQAMVLRSLTAIPCLLLFVRIFDGPLSTLFAPGWWKLLARGALNFSAYCLYYLGLASMPMGEVVAINFVGPLVITLAAWVMLGERVAPRALVAIFFGFSGVLMIVRPGAETFQPAALLPMCGASCYAISMVMTRKWAGVGSAASMAVWSNSCFMVLALILSAMFWQGSSGKGLHPAMAFLTRGWAMPPALDLILMLSCGVVASIGMVLLNYAYRIAPSGAIAPMEYSYMFWALLWGWSFFGEVPDTAGLLGMLIIVGAGLFVLRQPPLPTIAPKPAA
ncbi:DMT family transporter [Xinfangfangia sp. CPCC 101601]|uniref:DMT family transporter n=1 Tax=Pseudogemmobacter lacusdianii TaxID=3069608 RepID=A0ABU0W128_9RHOB|nr:DMT family transporter [Xinfangfangia sp. CPCC 101601]MDQ2067719.1 DMT family transporter [Xinfangfangia sp. CPCC 101601]